MSHPDEGLIHAWLDGELDAAEAARVEALVRDDPAWGAAAAEARGLIAASARIVGALDHVPANVVPKVRGADRRVAPAAPGRGTAVPRRTLPWWAARAAAVLVVATGTVVVFSRTSPEEQAALTAAAPTAAPGPARQADSVADKLVAAAPAAPAFAKAKDLASTAGRAGAGAASNAPLNEADTKTRAALNDARVEGKFAAAELTRRDSAGQAKLTSTDERRLIAADQAAAGAAAELKKEAGAAGAQPAKAQSALGQVAAAPPAPAAREECYREGTAVAGGAPVVHRVGRTGDTTAIAGALLGLRSETDAVRARQMPTAAARAIAPGQDANQVLPAMRVRGDTLFVRIANGTTRVALRITCPAP